MAEPVNMFTLGPDGKPDLLATLSSLIKRVNDNTFRIEKVEMELATLAKKPPTDPAEFGMNGQQFDKHTRGEQAPPAAPPPARPAPAASTPTRRDPASRQGEKEFWYKDDRGGSQTVFLDMEDPICPFCKQPMDLPRKDKYNNPSLYCKSCRVYFNWSKHNDGGGRGGRAPARQSRGGDRRW